MGSNGLAFKEWAVKDNVVQVTPIEKFKGRSIGIDAEDYCHSLLVFENREPLLPAHGGKPFSFNKRVDEDLQSFRDAGIKPWFVFSGLDLACKDRSSRLNEGRRASVILNEAWQTYDQAQGEDAVQKFGKICAYRSYHIVRSLQMYLHTQGARIQVAPYTAASQLAYLEREEYIDGVQGSASCLVYGSDKVILSYDWEKKQVVWVSLQKCLAKLELDRDQFVNACLLSGSSILPAIPELDTDSPMPRIQAAKSLLKSVNNDVDSLLRHKEGDWHKLFYKARFALKHPVVLQTGGKVEPLDWQSGPSDAHEFIGQRLPEEVFRYLSHGLIGPRVLNWRTRMEVLETPPLDGGLSPAYKDLVQGRLQPLRAQALTLLTHSLNRYYQKNDVDLVCWFNDTNKVPLNIPDRPERTKNADKWHVKAGQMPKSSDADPDGSSLLYGILSLANDSEAKKTVTPRPAGSGAQVKELKEIRANTVWRFLQDRGYVNSDHTLSAWGKALKAAFERAMGKVNISDAAARTEMEEAVLMAFELLRLDLLGTQQMFPLPPYSGAPMKGSDTDKSNTVLIGRVACLGVLQHRAIGYTGLLSRNLLAYHQMAATVRGALRDLLEMHACHMFLSGVVDRNLPTVALTTLGASLPFVNEPDVGLGLVVKSYLDELSSNQPTNVHKWFMHAVDIDADLDKAWNLWDAINAGVQAADSSIVKSDTKMTFKNADEWLKGKLEHANVPNGTAYVSEGRKPSPSPTQ